MIPIELNVPELGRRPRRRLRRRWNPHQKQGGPLPFRGEDVSAAGLPRAVLPSTQERLPPRARRGLRLPLASLRRLRRSEEGQAPGATPAEAVETPAVVSPEQSYVQETQENIQGAEDHQNHLMATSSTELTQLSEQLALQVAEGQRGLIVPLADNLFLVSSVPEETLKPELGLVPAVAEVLVSTATHALSQPQTQEALAKLVQKAGNGIAKLTQKHHRAKKEERDDVKTHTPEARHKRSREVRHPEPLYVRVSPTPMPLPGELRPVMPSQWSPAPYPPAPWPGYYINATHTIPVQPPPQVRLRGEYSAESPLDIIIGAIETHLDTLEDASLNCNCQRRS